MTRRLALVLALIYALWLAPSVLAESDASVILKDDSVFAFPSSLRIIEDSAFAGTAVKIVILPSGLEYIGRGVFASAHRLKAVYIPKSTVYIGEDAFAGSKQVTIHGVAGSYAQDWARKYHIPFSLDDIWTDTHRESERIGSQLTLAWRGITVNPEMKTGHTDQGRNREICMRPQERAELHPIDYRFP